MPLDDDEDESDMEEDDHLHMSSDAEEHEEQHSDGLLDSMRDRDAADEFQERVMRVIERNVKRTISENDVAIDIYDNDTVLV